MNIAAVAEAGERRRTQAERRAETMGRLIDAAIETLAECGYARASTHEICRRAGLSQGGLFRHFPTRLDLIVAAADAVTDRHLERFTEAMAAIGDPVQRLKTAVRVARERCGSRENAVWAELTVAARTDEELRQRLAPVARRMQDDVVAAAHRLAWPEGGVPPGLEAMMVGVIRMWDGARLLHPLLTDGSEIDDSIVAGFDALIDLIVRLEPDRSAGVVSSSTTGGPG